VPSNTPVQKVVRYQIKWGQCSADTNTQQGLDGGGGRESVHTSTGRIRGTSARAYARISASSQSLWTRQYGRASHVCIAKRKPDGAQPPCMFSLRIKFFKSQSPRTRHEPELAYNANEPELSAASMPTGLMIQIPSSIRPKSFVVASSPISPKGCGNPVVSLLADLRPRFLFDSEGAIRIHDFAWNGTIRHLAKPLF
jgi:hypothetical protein